METVILYIPHPRQKSFIFYIFNIVTQLEHILPGSDIVCAEKNREAYLIMGTIVCKFGGTSVANGERLKSIRAILDRNEDRRYVVLSAPGVDTLQIKLTDSLYRLWRVREQEELKYKEIEAIAARFDAMCQSLGIDLMGDAVRETLKLALETSEAHTVSRGEYLCARLFSDYIGWPMMDAVGLIAFDGRRRLDKAKTCENLSSMANTFSRAVIPGFYGADPYGNIVTFPRNGSDITGALVAAGVGASLYENWTDVPGLMTDDPAANPHAEVIPEISYADMRYMTMKGARVMHPESLEPVETAGIPTRIKCTMKPDAPGTLIH